MNLSGGGYSLTVGDYTRSGPSGAVIQQNNATVTTSGSVGLGYTGTDVGTYTISSGALNVGVGLVVGRNSSGANAFTQTGGTVSVAACWHWYWPNARQRPAEPARTICRVETYTRRTSTRGNSTTCTATFNFQGGTIAPYTGNNMTIGSSASASNIVLTLTGSGGTISAIDSGSVARTVNVYSKITGGYGLTFTGAGGTINLLTANDYTGTTTVSAGTLQLGDGTSGHDGSIAGASIVNNAALVYNLYGNQTYSGAISGSGYADQVGRRHADPKRQQHRGQLVFGNNQPSRRRQQRTENHRNDGNYHQQQHYRIERRISFGNAHPANQRRDLELERR